MKLIYIILLVVLIVSIVLAETDEKKQHKNKSKSKEPSSKSIAYHVYKDTRECLYPKCGGYFIKPVNEPHGKTKDELLYVSKFLFDTGIVFNKSLILEANDQDLILSGHFKETTSYNELCISNAYRVVPISNKIDKNTIYFTLEKEKHSNFKLTQVNTGKVHTVSNYRSNYTSVSHIDSTWLTEKIQDNAIVSGNIINGKDKNSYALSIDRVFIHLPDPTVKCKELPLAKCEANHVMAFKRDSNRCLSFDGCVKSGLCTLSIPLCNKGYKLTSFASRPNGCPSYFCDPDYL